VTSDGKFYPTSNHDFVPSGYVRSDVGSPTPGITPQNQTTALGGRQGLASGAFVGNKGEQVTVTQGNRAARDTGGEFIRQVEGGNYQPARLGNANGGPLQNRIVGIATDNLPASPASGRVENPTTIYLGSNQSLLLSDESTSSKTVLNSLPHSWINGRNTTNLDNGDRNGDRSRTTSGRSFTNPYGNLVGSQYYGLVQETFPLLRGTNFVASKQEIVAKGYESLFVGANTVAKEYSAVREKWVASPQLYRIENMLYNTRVANQESVTKFSEIIPSKYGSARQEVRSLGEITLVRPAGVLSGVVKSIREVPETIPLSYGAGKVLTWGGESVAFLSSRFATMSAGEGVFLRTSTAGIAKGVRAVPYAIGGLFAADVGAEVANRNSTEADVYVGSQVPMIVGFSYGDLSARGQAQQAILRSYVSLTGAKRLSPSSIVEPSVMKFYEQGAVSGAQKFSVISPAGNLKANRVAFERATFNRITYTQRVVDVPVGNAVSQVSPFIVGSNPAVEVLSRTPGASVKNYDVITATQGWFNSQTSVLRGTSRQGGLYVAPTGQAQLYFLGLGKETPYSIGFAGYSEPNLVRIRNVKQYSEELLPFFKEEGQSNTVLSDAFLREKGSGKTVYVDSRTYFGETPEVQAVLPEGTPLKQLNLRGGVQKFFGFRNYIEVDNTIIPVRAYTALNKKAVPKTSASFAEVSRLTRESESYSRYQRTVDPLRSLLGSRREASRSRTNDVYDSGVSGKRSVRFLSYSSSRSGTRAPSGFDYDIAPSRGGILRRGGSSITPSRISSLLGGSRGSTTGGSSVPSRTVLRGMPSRSSGRSMPGSFGSGSFRLPPKLGFNFGGSRDRKRKEKGQHTEYGYSPSLLGLTDLSGPSFAGYSGLGVRGVTGRGRNYARGLEGFLGVA
jgi:hypothetical protein